MNLKEIYSYINSYPNSLFLLQSIIKLKFNEENDSIKFYNSDNWKIVFDFTICNSVYMKNE